MFQGSEKSTAEEMSSNIFDPNSKYFQYLYKYIGLALLGAVMAGLAYSLFSRIRDKTQVQPLTSGKTTNIVQHKVGKRCTKSSILIQQLSTQTHTSILFVLEHLQRIQRIQETRRMVNDFHEAFSSSYHEMKRRHRQERRAWFKNMIKSYREQVKQKTKRTSKA